MGDDRGVRFQAGAVPMASFLELEGDLQQTCKNQTNPEVPRHSRNGKGRPPVIF